MNPSIPRRGLLAGGFAAAALPRAAWSQAKPIRIGVLTDMVGVYAANTGQGSVTGAKLAIEDFAKLHPNVKVELVSADLQLQPDVAVGVAGDWFDNQGVDLITDVPLSSAAFAIGALVIGFLVDRANVRWIYPLMVVGWSLAGFATGFAESMGTLLLCRFLLGLFDFLAVTVVAFGHGVNRVEVVRACALQKLQWLRRLSCGLTKSKQSESSIFRNDFYAQHAEPRISRPRTSSSSLALEVLRRR